MSLSHFFSALFCMLLVYFIYQGLTTSVWEGDSLAYHIPIAQNILEGKFTDFDSLLYYYPASSHVILALFIALNIPLQLFNVVAWVLFFYVSRRLARTAGLNQDFSTIFATAVVTLTSVIRLVQTQTIDIWIGIFFCTSLILLLQPKKSVQYFIQLGLSLGMLAGTKFSGPLFIIALVFIFGKQLMSKLSTKSAISALLAFSVSGMPWYIRNVAISGDPFYPASNPAFPMMRWQTYQTIFFYPGGFKLFFESLVSEYLIWASLIFVVPLLLWKYKKRNATFSIGLLGVVNFMIHLILPAAAPNTLSDLRYAFPAFVALLLFIFLYAKEKGKELELAIIAIIPALATLTLVQHRPKLFLIAGGVIAVFYLWFKPWYDQKYGKNHQKV